MDQKKFQELQTIKEQLQEHHGATRLQNIPEFTSSALYKDLTQTSTIGYSLDITVSAVIQRIDDILSAESIILQFAKYQWQMRNKSILPSSRSQENQRLEFYKSKNIHERLEMIFSLKEYYFTINPTSFKFGDKRYNREVFQNAIDTIIIDPENVADSSLETLGITLDPDCQNLKEIFKKMHPLNYQDTDERKYTVRIHEYEGKYIVFAAHKTMYNATQPATKGEQRKEDVKAHMSVYPDIFSMIRREEHIIDSAQEKQEEYQDIKKKLIASIKEIDRNKKEYGPRVQQNVQEIIADIDKATSARIMADKIYHLYKVYGKHSENDKKLLEASMRNFTQRIAQLVGIAFHTQLHLLELNDVLEDQNLNLELFYHQIAMFLEDPKTGYDKFLIAFENYYRSQKWPLKEPFRTFDKQINQCFGDLSVLIKKEPRSIMMKAKIIVTLQRKYRETCVWEHEYKRGELSAEELQENLLDTSLDESIKEYSLWLYNAVFAHITEKRAKFSPDFTKPQLNRFFDDLNDLHRLQETINDLLNMLQ